MRLIQPLERALYDNLDAVPEPGPAAVKTWRYLRLAMVGMVIGLAASVVHEHLRVPGDCWQESLSAYYYTPARGYLVGALVTIGVCLVCLKGSTEWEDLLLNLAGICAPVVAFVPVPTPGHCGAVPDAAIARGLDIANNMVALLVAGGFGLAFLAVWALRAYRVDGADKPTGAAVAGYGVASVLYVLTWIVFVSSRAWFTQHAHPIAAVAMFVFIFFTVCLNAFHYRQVNRSTGAHLVNRYTVIALLMPAAAVVTVVLGAYGGWRDWILGLESSQIILFGTFWWVQTFELWGGLRPAPGRARPSTRPSPRGAPGLPA